MDSFTQKGRDGGGLGPGAPVSAVIQGTNFKDMNEPVRHTLQDIPHSLTRPTVQQLGETQIPADLEILVDRNLILCNNPTRFESGPLQTFPVSSSLNSDIDRITFIAEMILYCLF